MTRTFARGITVAAILAGLVSPASGQTVIGMPVETLQSALEQSDISYIRTPAAESGGQLRLMATYMVQFAGQLCNGTTVLNPDYRTLCGCQLTYLSDDGQRVTRILHDLRPACGPPPAPLLDLARR